jgi:hypothetical protein
MRKLDRLEDEGSGSVLYQSDGRAPSYHLAELSMTKWKKRIEPWRNENGRNESEESGGQLLATVETSRMTERDERSRVHD